MQINLKICENLLKDTVNIEELTINVRITVVKYLLLHDVSIRYKKYDCGYELLTSCSKNSLLQLIDDLEVTLDVSVYI